MHQVRSVEEASISKGSEDTHVTSSIDAEDNFLGMKRTTWTTSLDLGRVYHDCAQTSHEQSQHDDSE